LTARSANLRQGNFDGLSTTQRYMHLSPAATEDAIRLLDGRDCGVGLVGNSGDTLDTRRRWSEAMMSAFAPKHYGANERSE
jgi:hypothetical protein